MKNLILLILLITASSSFGQKEYNVEFKINDLKDKKLWLVFYYGDQQIRIDTAVTDTAGQVAFTLNDLDDVGMYRLEQDDDHGIDFLFNREDVNITAGSDFRLNSLTVNESLENSIFFDYYRHKYDLENRLDLLGNFLRYYPRSDTFYFNAASHAEKLAHIYQDYLDSILVDYPDLLVTRIIRFDQLPDIKPGTLDAPTRNLYRAHYFDGVDLKDTLILNTPLLPVKIIDYLSLFVQPGTSREQQEGQFIMAVDSLMKFSEGSPKVREMIVNYLISGFQAYGFEDVLTHLVEDYVLGQSCVSNQEEEKLKTRIEGFKRLAVGTPAPDFEIRDSNGKLITLSSFRGQKVLLIFWSSTCPHCKAILPEINNLYSQYGSKVAFIGISIDDDEKSWQKAIEEGHLQFENVSELQGWNGKAILDYYVYATPTFLLIDPTGRIMAKPVGLADLKAAISK